MIYWFTGQPGAGKTTLAEHLITYLGQTDRVIHIDGDDLRMIFDNKDYSEDGRRRNIERAQDIALFLDSKRYNVVVSVIAPYKDQREKFKKLSNCIEIYVHTSEKRGREDFHVKHYDPPTENFIEVNTDNRRVDESFIEMLKYLDL